MKLVFPCLIMGIAFAACADTPEHITRLRAIDTDTLLVANGKASAMIVYPGPPSNEREQAYWEYADPEGGSDAYAGLAHELAAAIETVTGVSVPLRRADEYTPADREHNLICLGRMNNNRLAYELYVDHRIAADDWFPGPDGYVARTVTDPWGLGRNVILLGGSDFAGVRRAMNYFLELPALGNRAATLKVPRQWKIDFAGMAEHGREFAKTIAPHYEEAFFSRPFSCGAGGTSGQTWRAAERYFVTGFPEFAETFEKMMRVVLPSQWDEETTRALLQSARGPGGMQRYSAAKIGPLYAAIEDTPHLSDEFRLDMVNWLYKTFWRWCGNSYLRNWREGEIRGLGAWNAARVPVSRGDYFRRHYPEVDLSRYDDALVNIKTGLRALAREHNLFTENGGYTRYGPSIVMDMFRKFEMMEFFESGNAARFMEFLIQRTQNGGRRGVYTGLGREGLQDGWLYPVLYYLKPEYAWVSGQPAGSLQPRLDADRLSYRLWTFVPKMPTALPEDMTGMLKTAISEVAHEHYNVTIPVHRTYRILTMRSGYDFSKDQYLLMYGSDRYGLITSGGGSRNEITALQHGRKGSASNVRSETFNVLRDGVAVEFEAFSDLRVFSEQRDAGFVRSVVAGDHADWSRDVFWRIGDYWLIIDRIAVKKAGDYRFAVDWTEHGLNIRRAAGESDFSGDFKRGDEYVFANLISGEETRDIRRIDDNLYAISENGREVLAGSSRLQANADRNLVLNDRFTLESDLFMLADDSLSFAGLRRFGGEQPLIAADVPVDLTLDFEAGRMEVDASRPVVFEFTGMKVAGASSLRLETGRHDLAIEVEPQLVETVARAIAAALQRPETPVTFKPVAIDYPAAIRERWRYETGTTPLLIRAADLDGDGRDELLVGLEDGRLKRLSPDGVKQWEFQASGNSINDIAVADLGRGLRVLVSSSDTHVYCLDAATGELDWKFSGAGLDLKVATDSDLERNSALRPGGPMHAILVADIDGNGEKSVLVGGGAMESVSFVCGRLWVLDARGQLRWQRFMRWAAAMSQLAVFEPGQDGRKYIAVAGHGGPYSRRIHVFDHAGNSVEFKHPGRYFHVRTARAGAREAVGEQGAERLLTLNLLHGPEGPVIKAFSTNPAPESPGWIYGFPFPIWRYRLAGGRPLGFVTADLTGDGIEEIVTGHDGGIISCLKETGAYPSGRADVAVEWRLNLREALVGSTTRPTMPSPQLLVAPGLARGPRKIAFASGGRLFVIDSDGMPLVRAEPLADVFVEDRRGNVSFAQWTWLEPANLDGNDMESLVGAAAVRQRRDRVGELGFVAVYDLARKDPLPLAPAE